MLLPELLRRCRIGWRSRDGPRWPRRRKPRSNTARRGSSRPGWLRLSGSVRLAWLLRRLHRIRTIARLLRGLLAWALVVLGWLVHWVEDPRPGLLWVGRRACGHRSGHSRRSWAREAAPVRWRGSHRRLLLRHIRRRQARGQAGPRRPLGLVLRPPCPDWLRGWL